MSRFKHDLILQGVKYLNVLLMAVIYGIIWMNFYSPQMYRYAFYRRGNWLVIGLFAFLYYIIGRTYDAFEISYQKIFEIVYSEGLAMFFADLAMMVVTWLLMRRFPNLWPFILLLVLQLIVAIIWALFSHKLYFSLFRAKKTIILYDMREGMEELISEYGLEVKFKIIKTIQCQEALSQGLEILDGCEAVFFCGIHSHERNILLKYCIAHKISVFVIPRIGDTLMTGARRTHMLHLPVLRLDGYSPKPEYLIIKRLFDIVISGLSLAILSPMMLVVAMLIKRDGGPALYKQVRLTKDGKEFKVLKFRSMRVDAEKDGVARLSSGDNDDRITPVGRVIRKVRIELMVIIRQTTKSLVNQGFCEVSPIHFSLGRDLFSKNNNGCYFCSGMKLLA